MSYRFLAPQQPAGRRGRAALPEDPGRGRLGHRGRGVLAGVDPADEPPAPGCRAEQPLGRPVQVDEGLGRVGQLEVSDGREGAVVSVTGRDGELAANLAAGAVAAHRPGRDQALAFPGASTSAPGLPHAGARVDHPLAAANLVTSRRRPRWRNRWGWRASRAAPARVASR
jgi:hypothetical protein